MDQALRSCKLIVSWSRNGLRQSESNLNQDLTTLFCLFQWSLKNWKDNCVMKLLSGLKIIHIYPEEPLKILLSNLQQILLLVLNFTLQIVASCLDFCLRCCVLDIDLFRGAQVLFSKATFIPVKAWVSFNQSYESECLKACLCTVTEHCKQIARDSSFICACLSAVLAQIEEAKTLASMLLWLD